MKISKYIHSCLLFEKDGFKLLVDPGTFTFAEGIVIAEEFGDVSAVIITHNHPDHLDVENLTKIIAISGAAVYTNEEVAKQLKATGLDSLPMKEGSITIGPFKIEVINVVHQPLLDSPTPLMTALLIDGKVLHPVDSFESKLLKYKNVDMLIMPTMAPFATELDIAAFADAIKPKQILPVHDGFAKDFFLKQRYKNYVKHFKNNDIEFLELTKAGDSVSIP